MKYLQANEVAYTYRNKYQTVHALRGVSADFMPGKMYAIIVPPAAAKLHFCLCWRGWMCRRPVALPGMGKRLPSLTGMPTGWNMSR